MTTHHESPSRDPISVRVLVTGAGGAAAVSFMRAVADEDVRLYAADIDPHAAGLYLVPPERRVLVPRGDDPGFARRIVELCSELGIDVLVPTVDTELLPLARVRSLLRSAGVRTVLADTATLETCLDKVALVRRCEDVVPVPRTGVLDERFEPADWRYPVIVKPRSGSGGRGVWLARSADELAALGSDPTLMVQDYLPGEEYSVDVFADAGGVVRAAVPRVRAKVDSGVAVASRTVQDPQLEAMARAVAERIGLRYVANVQFRRDEDGTPRLLEVNPRFPGTMPLTVRAGVNMPRLALETVLGEVGGGEELDFAEVAVVRHWEEVYVDPSEIDALTRRGGSAGTLLAVGA